MIGRLLVRHERWLPALTALAWWVIFYPGLFGEDSLINLGDARSGSISVWFTAWWVYVVDALSLGTRAIPLLTLAGVIGLCYCVYLWIITVFPRGAARAITVLAITATPLVGATGIQVRHDVGLACGLLICAAVLTRCWPPPHRLAAADYAWLALAAPLIATRHNGMPTVLASALVVAAISPRRWRQALALAAVALGAIVITIGATRASGNSASVDPVQTVEWLMADLSCVLTHDDVAPTEGEWRTLETIAPREQWAQPQACRRMNPLLIDRIAHEQAIVPNYRALVDVWRSLAMRHPLRMLAAHATRVRLFLPPFVTGMPDLPTFLHSTIEPNDFGLAWQWPALAGTARLAIRAWNAAGVVLANSALWLIVLIVTAWRRATWRQLLIPTIIVGAVLNLGLIAAAPISEGRYGIFILICAQATLLYTCCEKMAGTPARPEAGSTRQT